VRLSPSTLVTVGSVKTLVIYLCHVGDFPIKYLGIPLHFQKLKREDLQPLIDKIIKRIASWRGQLLTQAGRLVLIKTCIASIPVYLLSFFKFPKWAIKLINSHMVHCFWDSYEGHKKMHLANWHLICMKKKHGGLGVPDIKDLNLCLLGSWVKRYILDENKIWTKVVHNKYCGRRNIFWSDRNHASPFWKGIIYAAQALKFGYRWVPGDGRTIRFWEDTWFGIAPLATQF
jgi:hypothetical protein